MTRTANPTTELGFEVERFEWAAADRLEVTGRWFGLGGRRFVRPVMNLRADGRRRRLIALLDHKPWMPDDDGAWTAAFAWRGEQAEVTGARLEVAPDVILDLPPPGDDAVGAVLHPREKKRAGAREDEAPAERHDDAPGQAAAAKAPAKTRDEARREPPARAASRESPAPAAAPPESPPAATGADSPPAAAPRESPPAAAPPAAAPPAAAPPADSPPAPRKSPPAAPRRESPPAADAPRIPVVSPTEIAATQERAARAERDLAAAQERAAIAAGDLAAMRRRLEILERLLDETKSRAELAERGLAQARGELADSRMRADAQERELEQARSELAAVRERADTAERERTAAREVAHAVEAELEAYGDVDDLRRRAETAERELAAAQERLRHRPVPDAMLAARGVSGRREPDWAGRIVGLVTVILIAIMAIAILKLLV